jgi:hypothetical protein
VNIISINIIKEKKYRHSSITATISEFFILEDEERNKPKEYNVREEYNTHDLVYKIRAEEEVKIVLKII